MTSMSKVEEGSNKKSVDEVLEEYLSLGYFHWRLLTICGLSFIADGMEISLMVFISSCTEKEWNLSDNQVALLSSAVFGGQLLGTYFWGPVADIFGRRKAFIFSAAIISIAGLASGLAPTYMYLLALRGLVGFGLGGSSVPFDLLAEFCPPKQRGKFLIYIEYFWSIGSMMVAGLAWLILPHYSWRFLTIGTALPVALTCLVSMRLLPESPRWLCVQHREKEAEEVLTTATLVNGRYSPDLLANNPIELKPLLPCEQEDGLIQLLGELISPRHFAVTIPLWTVWACFGAAYYGVLLMTGDMFSSDSDDDSGSCSFNYGPIFLTAVAELFGCMIIVRFVDSQGRTRTQGVGYGLGAVGCVLMGLLAKKQYQGILWSMLARMGIFAASTVTWIHTPELFPTRVRATGHAVSNSSAQIGSFCAPFLINSGSDALVGSLLAAVSALAMMSVLTLPETSGTCLDQNVDDSFCVTEEMKGDLDNVEDSLSDRLYDDPQHLHSDAFHMETSAS